MNKLKIKVSKRKTDSDFIADPIDYPGSPIIGRGRNKWEAVGSLLYGLRHENSIWHDKLDFPAIEIEEDICEQ